MSGRPATTDIIPGDYAISVGRPNKPLPDGWRWEKLTDVARLATGHTPSRKFAEYWAGDIPWIGIKDARVHHGREIGTTYQTVTREGIDNSASVVLPPNTVCLSRTASVGYVTVMKRSMATSQDFVNWICSDQLVPKFLMYLLIAEKDSLFRFGKGTTHTTIYFPEVKALHIGMPSPDEQRRIVAKIEELFSDLDAGVAALKRAKANLKRYRAAVLKAAVEGKLTEQWRADHPDTEPADQLLARILTERRKRWEQDQLAKYEAKGKNPPKGWKDKYKEPAKPDTSELPEVPKGWCWATLDAVADITGGVTKDKKRESRPGMREVPYLRVANVQRGFLDMSEIKSISTSEHIIADLRLQPGDVLFTEGGDRDKLGRGWVWQGELEECIHQNHIFRARLFGVELLPRLVSHHGNTFGQEWFSTAGKQTTNLASVNLGQLRQFPVPIAPTHEQREIDCLIAEKLSQIDAAEKAIAPGLARAVRLRQGILKRAFKGRLVPSVAIEGESFSNVLFPDLETSTQQREPMVATRGVAPKHRKGINFYRGAVLCYTIEALHDSPAFGRTQAMKILYLCEAWLGLDLELEPKRHAAGPLDEAIYKVENLAKKQGWFTMRKQGPIYRYKPGNNIADRVRAAATILGDKRPELDRLLRSIRKMDTEGSELFATTFAVWNDRLNECTNVSEDVIVADVHAWHESKRHKFSSDRIKRAISWMKTEGFVPQGKGPQSRPRG